MAQILANEAGENKFLGISSYETGRMTDVVYAVDGGMEDWAYGASWEESISPGVIPHCSAVPVDQTVYNQQTHRAFIYLVETASSKMPNSAFLGSMAGMESSSDKYSYGYIPINMKLSLALIDLVEPYIK